MSFFDKLHKAGSFWLHLENIPAVMVSANSLVAIHTGSFQPCAAWCKAAICQTVGEPTSGLLYPMFDQ